jgi:hypothetical protein
VLPWPGLLAAETKNDIALVFQCAACRLEALGPMGDMVFV